MPVWSFRTRPEAVEERKVIRRKAAAQGAKVKLDVVEAPRGPANPFGPTFTLISTMRKTKRRK
jgi:hypothetical protein